MKEAAAIENQMRWKIEERNAWQRHLAALEGLVTFNNKRYEQKLLDIKDFVKARIMEIKI